MHIVITDSGVGGLSVVALADRFLRTHGFTEPVKLTFVNAAPENDYGYNSMPTRKEKLDTFERFLRNVTARFDPELIYVACNTLSVLLPETPYFGAAAIKGIIETAVAVLVKELEADPSSVAILFGTPTTIEAGAYPRQLRDCGIEGARIISQACPGLADIISEDREGSASAAEIRHWVETALEKNPRRDAPVVATLACTHYGYRANLFAAAFADAGVRATVVNPNERAVGDLFGKTLRVPSNREVDVRFVTRYAIPETTIEALAFFLGDISPRTVAAMQNFEHVPDLF